MSASEMPLLPLILHDVPSGLVQALAQEGIPYLDRTQHAMGGRFVLFDSMQRCCPVLSRGQTAIDINLLRQGKKEDPFEIMLDERSQRHQWNISGLAIVEETAQVDRRAIRQQLLAHLRRLLEKAGGIWLTLSAFPYPYRTALNFRFDYDEYDSNDFSTMLEAIAGNESATSHFVNGAAYLEHGDALLRLNGLDVGSHGFHHHTYRTTEENLKNIQRGIEVLTKLGLVPSGFVAPHGRFNRELLAAMESLQITHSSEFGLAYDDLPFFPHASNVLQIPIHPISLGLFLDAIHGEGSRRTSAIQQAVRAAVDHFRETARAKYNAGEPLFYYGHPTRRLGRFPQVLRAVFDTANAFSAIWKVTMTDFAAWWRERQRVQICVTQREDGFLITARHRTRRYRLAVEYWHGQHVARMPVNGRTLRFSPMALAYENRLSRPGVTAVRIDRPEGIRSHIRRLIDWERVTPLDDIPGGNWRHWAKRTLRRLGS